MPALAAAPPMRSALAPLSLVTALVIVASSGLAHLGAVEAQPAPADGGEDPLCLPVCEVATSRAGNAPPVTVVESGGEVTWTVLEGSYHTATSNEPTEDTDNHLQNEWTEAGCLDAFVSPRATVAFRVDGGALEVYHLDATDPSWRTCEEAIGLPDGSFVLSYHCNVHPRFQHGAILVTPST